MEQKSFLKRLGQSNHFVILPIKKLQLINDNDQGD
jgi:hypothetical protein